MESLADYTRANLGWPQFSEYRPMHPQSDGPYPRIRAVSVKVTYRIGSRTFRA